MIYMLLRKTKIFLIN